MIGPPAGALPLHLLTGLLPALSTICSHASPRGRGRRGEAPDTPTLVLSADELMEAGGVCQL